MRSDFLLVRIRSIQKQVADLKQQYRTNSNNGTEINLGGETKSGKRNMKASKTFNKYLRFNGVISDLLVLLDLEPYESLIPADSVGPMVNGLT